jgi:hypothetical protein
LPLDKLSTCYDPFLVTLFPHQKLSTMSDSSFITLLLSLTTLGL